MQLMQLKEEQRTIIEIWFLEKEHRFDMVVTRDRPTKLFSVF